MVARQRGFGADPRRDFQGLAQRRAAVGRVHGVHHYRKRGEASHAVGVGDDPVAQLRPSLAVAARLGPQHQVRKVHVPLVRRHVGAFRQVAQIAQVAVLDYLPVVFPVDSVDLHRLGLVDEVEESGKGAAQIDASPAAMADVEHPFELGEERTFVVEGLVLPVDGMAGRGFQAAFPNAGAGRTHVRTPLRGRPRLSVDAMIIPMSGGVTDARVAPEDNRSPPGIGSRRPISRAQGAAVALCARTRALRKQEAGRA